MAVTLVISAVDNSCWDVFISLIKQQILGVVAFSQSTYTCIGYLNEKTTAFRSLFELLSFCINACHADVIACRLIRVQALTSLMDFSWIIAISWRLKPSPRSMWSVPTADDARSGNRKQEHALVFVECACVWTICASGGTNLRYLGLICPMCGFYFDTI